MGYTLKIGEAYLSFDKEDSYLRIDVEGVKLDSAPAYGEPTDFTNQRWPSYTGWSDFTEFVGLYDLFNNKDDENCLIPEHPGYAVINQDIKAIIDEAYTNFYVKYPNCKPGFAPDLKFGEEDPNWPDENNYAVRLEWLKFWVDWSLDNCKIPILYNS